MTGTVTSRITWAGALALNLLCTPVTAEAKDTASTIWSQSGQWTILIDTARGDGCFIERIEDETHRVRLGYLPDRMGAFLSTSSPDWTDLTPGETHLLTLFFDTTVFGGDADLFQDGAFYGGRAFFNNPAILGEFAKSTSLKIVYTDGSNIDIGLSGTSKALKELDACQKDQS